MVTGGSINVMAKRKNGAGASNNTPGSPKASTKPIADISDTTPEKTDPPGAPDGDEAAGGKRTLVYVSDL